MVTTIKLILAASLLALSPITHAVLVDETPTQTSYTTVNGLDWLDWSATIGMNGNQALSANSGWRIATLSEATNLMNTTFGVLDYQGAGHSGFLSIRPEHDVMAGLFGITGNYNNHEYVYAIIAEGLLGSRLESAGNPTSAIAYLAASPAIYKLANGSVVTGIGLVRGTCNNCSVTGEVPVPATLALMGLGLLGLGYSRKKST